MLLRLFARSAEATLRRRHEEADAQRQQRGFAGSSVADPDVDTTIDEVESDRASSEASQGEHSEVGSPVIEEAEVSEEATSEGSNAWGLHDSHCPEEEEETDEEYGWSQDSHNPYNQLGASHELAAQLECEEVDERNRIEHNRWFYWTVASAVKARKS